MRLPVAKLVRPSSLAGATNGRLPRSILTEVEGQAGGATVRLVNEAARAWTAMVAAAAEAGIVLKVATADRSYRPFASQEFLFLGRYYPSILGTRWYKGQRWRKRKGVAAAAVPGTSNHGWGLAVDIGEELDGDDGTESISTAAVTWLVGNAARFGWSAEIQSERWHWRYVAGDAIPKAVLDYERRNASPTPIGGFPAMLIQYGFWTYLNEGWRYRFLSSAASVEAFKDAGVPVVKITDGNLSTWKALRAEALADGRLHGEPDEVADAY